MNHDIKKFAIITGGSSGIGKHYASRLAEMGYNIFIVSNNKKANEAVANEIRINSAVEVKCSFLDLSETSSVDEIIKIIDDEDLNVEVLICNAGILTFGGVISTNIKSLEKVIDLHCKIPTLLCKRIAEKMVLNHKGYILIMSSSTAWMPYPTIAAYSATKSYLKNFGQALYYELKDQGIKVTVVFPGAVDTPFYKLDNKIRKRLLKYGIMLLPETVARKALKDLFNGRHKSVPGVFNNLCSGICSILPVKALNPVLKIKKLRNLW